MSRKPDASAQNDRNEYIPSFITKKPFYVPDDDNSAETNDYLEHQRLQEKKEADNRWYDRGKKLGPAATKFRKGACENCGAMTHKTKECLSRPRKSKARWTGKDIQADEVVEDIKVGWDAKRDRWNGYDASEYKNVIEDYEDMERMKKRLKLGDGPEADGEGAEAEAEDTKYGEESDMGRGQSTSTRQLRLREDTAKYLLNLDLDSAKYDPKTRSMTDTGVQSDQAAALVADENFMRASGDAAAFERAQRYAWETQDKGGASQLHLQANPTSGEVLHKKEQEAAKIKRESERKALLEKYGGVEHLNKAPLADAVTENEKYVEYDEFGGVKGAIKAEAKSKYAEDVLINNHTTVWGSWWKNFQWGYSCCHSTMKNSYCTGEAGKQAFEETEQMRTGGQLVQQSEEDGAHEAAQQTAADTAKDKAPEKRKRDDFERRGITEEEFEKYQRSKAAANDPMAKLLGKDELV